ncbi:co-chaperone GroES [Candidatus Parcubacteria bacterium]|nr:co-chaperone GroES [Candidatus Parcubacteria bacterium]
MKNNKKKQRISAKKTVRKPSSRGITPLGDRVLVKPESAEEEKNIGGIIIPETSEKEKPARGKVIAVGEGKVVDGKRIPVDVSVGDTVVFSKYGYDEVKIGDEELYIIKEENILAVIK